MSEPSANENLPAEAAAAEPSAEPATETVPAVSETVPAAAAPVLPTLDPGVRPHPPLHTAPKKPRPPQTIRNITYSIGLIAIVSVALFIFVKLTGSPEYDKSPTDVAAAAKTAQSQADFTVAVPALPAEYFASQALFSAGDAPLWTLYFANGGGAIVVNQAKTLDESFVKDELGAISERSDVTIAGVACEKTRSAGGTSMASGKELWALKCAASDSAVLVSGNVTFKRVETVATAVLTSLAK